MTDAPDLPELLLRAGAQISDTLTVRLRPLGLQVDEMRVLAALRTEDGARMGSLAEGLVIGNATLTKMVDRLVSDNLVYRKPDAQDRRRVRLYLTPEGRGIAAKAGEIVAGYRSELADRLGPDATLDRALRLFLDAAE